MTIPSANITAESFMSNLELIERNIRNDPNTCIAIVQPGKVAFLKVFRESSILVEKWSNPSIINVTEQLIMSFCGNEADFRVLSGFAKKQAARYLVIHEKAISIAMLVKELSALLNQYTRMWTYRPFTASILLGGNGVLYKINPGGEVFHYESGVQVIGDKAEDIELLLRKDNLLCLPLVEAVNKSAAVLREVENLQTGDIRVTRSHTTGPEGSAAAFVTMII